ncbi:MAG: hypothetical protein ABSF25_21350 [Bryobacteraceae bacterium]
MKQSALVVVLLIYFGLCYPAEAGPKKYPKETVAGMSNAKTIFLGWVDLSPESWSLWGYRNKEEWMSVISDLNLEFQSDCKGQYLAGRTVTAAKNGNDGDAAGNDLYIRFSNVNIDHDYYGIRLSIQFIDPKTNAEIASIPSRLYYEKRWFKFQLYMRAALDDIGRKIQAEVTGAVRKK